MVAFVDFAIVHHADQYMITNGYPNRQGLDEIIGFRGKERGYFKVFELHKKYRIPLNLHLSGTLLETILWHRPDFLLRLKSLRRQGMLDLVGSSYGQKIMRLLGHSQHFRQLNEEIRLYRRHLGVKPRSHKVFWPTEQIWDTEGPVLWLADKHLLNGGYKYVLVEDRLLYQLKRQRGMAREVSDQGEKWDVADFLPRRVLEGQGLIALPISISLKQGIPPREKTGLERLEELFHWLAAENPRTEGSLIAIYGDDLGKSAGCCGWEEGGVAQYETLLKWLVRNSWVRPVKLNEWVASCNACQKPMETTTYVEMGCPLKGEEDRGELKGGLKWERYRRYYAWSEGKVRDFVEKGVDPGLLEMALKHLLASSWGTALSAPQPGIHGDVSPSLEPSPQAKVIASHSRHAAVIVEAAYWMRHKDRMAHAYLDDVDDDGHKELILRNDRILAVFSPSYGGRLVYLFKISGIRGKMVIGNPCDDWDWTEEMNKYMERPPNHPGALAEVQHENDRYEGIVTESCGNEVRAAFVNKEEGSQIFGLEKSLRLRWDKSEIEVTYQLPRMMPPLSVECGLSPDYFHLVRLGRISLKPTGDSNIRGYSNNGVSVWVRLGDPTQTVFSEALPREFGHGYAVQFQALKSPFKVWIGTR